MTSAFRAFCAIAVLTLAGGASSFLQAQTPSATPDPFLIQLTNTPTAAFNTVAGDGTGNGRFVVFESNADVATEKTATRNNADGNREIFLADYAQRRIFQITNTKNVLKPPPTPSPTPTPSPSPSPTASPSPTPTPAPTPADRTLVAIEISSNRPVITYAPPASGGARVFTIVFSSNAPNPASFDGVDTGGALAADGNQEIWIYQLPAVTDVSLTTGADLPLQDLAAGTFTRITNTPASRLPTAGDTNNAPFVADDNRGQTITDDGNIIAFTSTRNLVPSVGNTDGNPELFFYNVTSGSFVQVTSTQDIFNGTLLVQSIFNENPCLSADGSVFAFISNGNLAGANDDGSGRGNAEVYVGNFSGSAVSNLRQATRTKDAPGRTANIFSPGRRLSRDGALFAFQSLAADPKGNSSTAELNYAIFVYTLSSDTFVQVGPRSTFVPGDIINFPTFTDYTGLSPSTLLFASALNFRADGTVPPTANNSEGLNPTFSSQIFATQIPASTTNTFTRLSNHPPGAAFGGVRPLGTDTRRRIFYTLGGAELGQGNADFSTEVFYLLSPQVTTEAADALSFFTGASNMPVPVATPSPSPSPTPTPSPTPSPSPGTALGLAAGELGIIRANVDLAPANATATGASETLRSPALPVELNGVSVAVNGAAAGLYFVGNSPRQINFVVPRGQLPGFASIIVNNNGTVYRGGILIVAAQPDIFTTTNDAGGRAIVRNITNPLTPTFEPFTVKSTDASGNLVATVLEITLTGVRGAAPAEITVRVGTTDITPALTVRSNTEMPGFDIITFALPESLAGAGDVPIIVTVARSGAVFASRPADSAPHITISP